MKLSFFISKIVSMFRQKWSRDAARLSRSNVSEIPAGYSYLFLSKLVFSRVCFYQ